MITFEKAAIIGNAQKTGQVLTNKARLVAQLNEKAAEDMGIAHLLYDDHGVIRTGLSVIELDNVYDGARFTHEIQKIGKLEMVAVQVNAFRVFIQSGKKKKNDATKRMMLAFSVVQSGSPLELVEHMIRCGKGAGVVTIEAPEQLKLGNQEGGTRVDMSPAETGPLKQDYSSKHGWSANVTVTAVSDGFEVTRRANSPAKKLKQGPAAKLASEQEALEEGLLDVQRWAEKIAAGGTRPEKREALKVVEWAQSLIQPAQLIDTAPEREPEKTGVDAAVGNYPD